MDGERIYLAGPMRGIPLYNFPAFDEAKRLLEYSGHIVISPADLDRDSGFDPEQLPKDWDWSTLPAHFSLQAAIDRDIAAIRSVDKVGLLPGWQNSTGAKAEAGLARWMGKPVYELEPEDVLEEALRITSGDRQAQYGPPDQDFRRTAEMWSALFRHLLRDGEEFTSGHVAQAMILLKMSRQLHQRKRDNWVDVAGYARCGQQCDDAELQAS